ncbi:tip120 [Anaeramoeba flamelloides]|uniref:Tip120 n=1 Tax=Anaeramoeba flamelloides TaxID=1746091 RepID=A0AAV7Y7S6_9EUKA|nr:tip120 [Anaeramoeba flamelloides]
MFEKFKKNLLSNDRDLRYMALSDLNSDLEKKIGLFAIFNIHKKQIVRLVLQKLVDSSVEVCSLSVQSLEILIPFIDDSLVKEVLNEIIVSVFSNDQQLSEISYLAFHKILNKINYQQTTILTYFSEHLIPEIINHIEKNNFSSEKLKLFDLIRTVLMKFGLLLCLDQEFLQKFLMKSLQISRSQKVVECLCEFLSLANDEIFKSTIEIIIEKLIYEKQIDMVQQIIRTLKEISDIVKNKLGIFLNRIIPLITKYCIESKYKEENQLIEICIQSLERFIYKFPRYTQQYYETFLILFNKLLKYDNGDELEESLSSSFDSISDFISTSEEENSIKGDDNCCSEHTESVNSDNASENSGETDENEDLDDINSPWKVRRSIMNCISTLIVSSHKQLIKNFKDIYNLLVYSFIEKNNNICQINYKTFFQLLEQLSIMNLNVQEKQLIKKIVERNIHIVIQHCGQVLNNKRTQFKIIAIKIISKLFQLFSSLLHEYLEQIFLGIISTLDENEIKNIDLKIETVKCLTIIILNANQILIHPYFKNIFPFILKSIKRKNHRVSLTVLELLQQIPLIIRNKIDSLSNLNYQLFDNSWEIICKKLYHIICELLRLENSLPIIKKLLIKILSTIISYLGDILTNELPYTLKLLFSFLTIPSFTLTSIQAFHTIVKSNIKFSIKVIIHQLIEQLSYFLNSSKKELIYTSLQTLTLLFQKHNFEINEKFSENLLIKISKLINNSDIHLTLISINYVTSFLKKLPSIIDCVLNIILPNVYSILTNSLLHNLSIILDFFRELINYDQEYLNFNIFKRPLFKIIECHKIDTETFLIPKAFISISQILAMLVYESSEEIYVQTIEELTEKITKNDIKISSFAIITIGEIGKLIDLSKYSNLHLLLLSLFESKSNLIQCSASVAFGKLCCGNLEYYLPNILNFFKQSENFQYLIFKSLKEVIQNYNFNNTGMIINHTNHKTTNNKIVMNNKNNSTNSSYNNNYYYTPNNKNNNMEININNNQTYSFNGNHLNLIITLLFNNCTNEKQGIRKIVAECFGKLTLIKPKTIIKMLVKEIGNGPTVMRHTIITSVQFMIHKDNTTIDQVLFENIKHFYKCLSDEDSSIRLATLKLLNLALQYKPILIPRNLEDLLPLIYQESKMKKDLIHIVHIGELKNVIDNGLENRKAVITTLDLLLSSYSELINFSEYVEVIINFLLDINTDIICKINKIIIKIIFIRPLMIKSNLKRLLENLKSILFRNLSKYSIRKDHQQHKTMINSTLSLIVKLSSSVEISNSVLLSNFYDTIINKDLSLLEQLRKIESKNNNSKMKMDFSNYNYSNQIFLSRNYY